MCIKKGEKEGREEVNVELQRRIQKGAIAFSAFRTTTEARERIDFDLTYLPRDLLCPCSLWSQGLFSNDEL